MKTWKNVSISIGIGLLFVMLACDDVIFEQDISASYVRILAPTEEVELTTGKISFNWEPIEGADAYHIQIATPNFLNAIQIESDSLVVGSQYSKLLLPGDYEWRIRGENSAFETAYFSNTFSVIEVVVEP